MTQCKHFEIRYDKIRKEKRKKGKVRYGTIRYKIRYDSPLFVLQWGQFNVAALQIEIK